MHLHYHYHSSPRFERDVVRRLTRMEDAIQKLAVQEKTDMSQVDDKLAALTTAVAAEATIDASIETYLAGEPALITAAVEAALAAGSMNPAQLAVFDGLTASMAKNAGDLQTALTNAPQPVVVVPPVTDPTAPAPPVQA